jgi:hypothetical protein
LFVVGVEKTTFVLFCFVFVERRKNQDGFSVCQPFVPQEVGADDPSFLRPHFQLLLPSGS